MSIFHGYNLLMTRYLRHQLPRLISNNAFHCHALQDIRMSFFFSLFLAIGISYTYSTIHVAICITITMLS